MRSGLGLAVVLLPSLAAATSAHAGPLTVGADLGVTQSKVDANSESNPTLGAFARLACGNHVAGELEIARIGMAGAGAFNGMTFPGVDMKQASALLVVDFGGTRLVPVMLVGGGVDHTTWGSFRDSLYARAELGLGLEWRATGGLSLGADVRIGDRKLVSESRADVETYLEPKMLSEGEYRSARVALGVRF
jgi:hypothetical protein